MEKHMFQNIVGRLNTHAARREAVRETGENAYLYVITGYTVKGLAKYDPKLADLLSKVDGSTKELDTYILGRVERDATKG